jgi:hypothetical protein
LTFIKKNSIKRKLRGIIIPKRFNRGEKPYNNTKFFKKLDEMRVCAFRVIYEYFGK